MIEVGRFLEESNREGELALSEDLVYSKVILFQTPVKHSTNFLPHQIENPTAFPVNVCVEKIAGGKPFLLEK